jgi:hypothetical protein
VTVSRSTTWERTHTISEGDQVNRGAILQRSYEFTVEPTTIQQLPPTAFVLIDAAAGARRAVLGDCNPGLVLLPRVSDRPYLPDAAPAGPAAIVGAHGGTPLQPGPGTAGPVPGHPPPGQGIAPPGYDQPPTGYNRPPTSYDDESDDGYDDQPPTGYDDQPDDAARPFIPSYPPDVSGPEGHHHGRR